MKNMFLLAVFVIGFTVINLNAGYAMAGNMTGKQLFKKEGCILCHAIHGKGGSWGPNLSDIGKIRSYSWIRRQIKNPGLNFFTPHSFVIFHGKVYESIMPANKKINAKSLNRLTQYLASLK
ncbi:MAG: cytochrome c [Deltaproteobacteria bacterium]|nr:cytochrome c [Deltaproteobacteria bacterium]MCL5879781.1 cytochrome c [Deltaproteobacteria bacterium]MDA8303936.1 cytochrome c [Deltaproteobacteria bacterium]